MKILVGELVTESNVSISTICMIKQYDIEPDEDCIQKIGARGVLERSDITLIPSIYANAGAAGIVEKSTFTYIEHMFIGTLEKNLHEIDGVFLTLHGASGVEELGSRDHHILRKLCKLAGPYLPIAIACDPHGNLCKEYAESAIILRNYRESPHTGVDEIVGRIVEMLCELLKKWRNVHAVCHELPLILDGEQSVSVDEPVLSVNRHMDELGKDDRILSCSWYISYIRYNYDVTGCGIVVVPYSEQDLSCTQEATDRLAAYVRKEYHEFHYAGLTASPSKALQMILDFQDKPMFITDPGDNVTLDVTGWNTGTLHQALQTETTKEFLFATICDPATYQTLSTCKTGEEFLFALGVGFDEPNNAVELDAVVESSENLTGFMMYNHTLVFGYCVNVHIKGILIDIVVADTGQAVCGLHQFVSAGIDVDAYDIIVIRQGRIFPDFETKRKLCVISLTREATLQDTAYLPFKRIIRPMFPTDDT